MPKRIPIRAAKSIAREFDCRQVILAVWDGERTHIITYGQSLDDCDQAAHGGNFIKNALGWPASLCQTEPSRVQRLKRRIRELEQRLVEYESS